MSTAIDSLAEAIKARRALLFAGAGLSLSVGLPSWRELIKHMAQELGLDEELAEQSGYLTLAEYYRLKRGSIGPLRSWLDRHWRVCEEQVRSSKVHELIVQLDFPTIYTTNFDRNLEVAYEIHRRRFTKIVNARDLARATGEATQIVKLHGDFDDDRSLVLAETDYFNRLAFDSPLDIKFRADALGKTILFLGYSMSDTNIRLLLHRLQQTWSHSGYERDRPRSFVFMVRRNPVQEAVLGQWGMTVVTGEAAEPEDALLSFLTQLRELTKD